MMCELLAHVEPLAVDVCHTQLFTGSVVCLCCGRDLCVACSGSLAGTDVAVHSTCSSGFHPRVALQPVTFFEQHELQQALDQMAELIPNPLPQVIPYFMQIFIDYGS